MALHAQISFLASGRLNTLASKPNAHAAVRVWFRSFMVQKEQWYTSWGPKKLIFLIRDKDDAAMAGASVESCQFVVLRSPRGRLGSSRDMCNRLRRMRGRFHRCIHISKVLCAIPLLAMIPQSFGSRALWGAPSAGACGLGDHPTPDLSRRASESRAAPEKSK